MRRRILIFMLALFALGSIGLYQRWTKEGDKIEDLPLELIVPENSSPKEEKADFILPEGVRIRERFKLPEGYSRIPVLENSFEAYLRNLPLKPHGSLVQYYDGTLKQRSNVYDAVVDMDVGERDLQQCADAIMRLRAEYLYGQGRHKEILFHLTNGFPVDYQNWKNGYRIALDGNRTYWVKKQNLRNPIRISENTWTWFLLMQAPYPCQKSLNL
ncbi:protein of unknown function (4846) [Geosporobacter subterraneus DSM 17957]|uniref:Uncharacterized protein n=1 Tax=Geosporobacter subterraneus DSM 17957 TaxID=1121919 RepID=A0A1M6EBG0_9FIRM|nr:DUF4846 domain-containing protein [Geosporobacter subterraneus]SHI82812.1 protein of unknown function (4846) [Geosporobacter subterraneus DSM 17957]